MVVVGWGGLSKAADSDILSSYLARRRGILSENLKLLIDLVGKKKIEFSGQ